MDVMVLPEHQGRGIGRAMMTHVMQYLSERSRDGGIFANLMCALGRESFYEQFGFERRPYETRGSGMTQWMEYKEDTP